MNAIIDIKISNYFKNRTLNGGGGIKDILARPEMDMNSINVGDNDYLNLAAIANIVIPHSEIVFSNVFSSKGPQHRVEMALAKYVKMEACQITQSGYASNSGTMQALCDRNTHLYVDCYLHSSFRDGIALKKAIAHSFKHNDIEDLEQLIQKHGHGIIMVEGLYSVDGDLSPLKQIIELKKKYGCTLLIDESHSLGLYGEHGMGYASTFEEYNEIDIFTASLAKTLGSRAGMVAGSKKIVDFIRENSFHNIFSSSVMNYDIFKIEKILKQVPIMNDQREYLMKISKYFRDSMPKKYLRSNSTDITPIVTLFHDNEIDLVHMNKWMLKRNIFASCFIAPATVIPCLRFTLNANLTINQVNYMISCINEYYQLTIADNSQSSSLSYKL